MGAFNIEICSLTFHGVCITGPYEREQGGDIYWTPLSPSCVTSTMNVSLPVFLKVDFFLRLWLNVLRANFRLAESVEDAMFSSDRVGLTFKFWVEKQGSRLL